jgi:hypothetical protein
MAEETPAIRPDISGILDSIEVNTRNSATTLKSLFESQDEFQRSQARSARFAKLDAATEGAERGNTGGSGGGIGGVLSGAGAAASGLGGGLGALLGGAGTGIGLAGAGIGAALLGLSTVIDKIPSADEIKDSVETLLTIGDGYESRAEFFKDGGTLALMLGGLGIGLAAFGVGAAAAGGAQGVLEHFGQGDWPEKVKQNVVTLLSISDELGGNLSLLADGGAFTLAMTGIGIGLGVFGAGSAIAGAAEGLATFTAGDDWSQQIKDHVVTLMSISDELGGSLAFIGDSATFLLAMTGIAAGLAVFGAGSTVAGAAEGLASFTAGDDWSQQIKDHVLTLLSIGDELGGNVSLLADSGTFVAAMTGIGAGLAVFSAGEAAAGLAQFVTGEDWSQQIVDHVKTLLSIAELPGLGADTTRLALALGGIGAGLAAFSIGQGAAGVAEAISKFLSEEDFADKIKRQVETLLSITDDADPERAQAFISTMAAISNGLTDFAGGQFVGTLGNAATAILGMFGVDSPFDQIMDIADKSEDLERGADALVKITDALNSFGDISVSGLDDVDFEEFARKIGEAIPLLEGLANGGVVGGGWFDGPELDFGEGIFDPSLRIDELVDQINKVRQILGMQVIPMNVPAPPPVAVGTVTTTPQTPEAVPAPTVETETPELPASPTLETETPVAVPVQVESENSTPQSNQPTTRVMTNDGFKDLTREEIEAGIQDGSIRRSIGRSAQRELDLQSREDGTYIAGERVVEGQPLTDNQRAAVESRNAQAGIPSGIEVETQTPQVTYDDGSMTNRTEALSRESSEMTNRPAAVMVTGGNTTRGGDTYNNGGNTNTTTIINQSSDPVRALRHVPM